MWRKIIATPLIKKGVVVERSMSLLESISRLDSLLVHELCHSLANTDSELNTHTNSSFDIPPNILDTPTNTFISPSVCTLVSRYISSIRCVYSRH